MNLDIIARLVKILRESPELGAIELRRGLFGAWSTVRVSRAGHASGAGDHVVVTPPAGAGHSPAPLAAEPARGKPEAPAVPAGPALLEIKSPMVGTFYTAP